MALRKAMSVFNGPSSEQYRYNDLDTSITCSFRRHILLGLLQLHLLDLTLTWIKEINQSFYNFHAIKHHCW